MYCRVVLSKDKPVQDISCHDAIHAHHHHYLFANFYFLGIDYLTKSCLSVVVTHLNCRIVGVLVVDKEGSPDLAAIWILSLSIEELFVEVNIVNINSTVECQSDHLWNLVIDLNRVIVSNEKLGIFIIF
jgi:hypothetical protein